MSTASTSTNPLSSTSATIPPPPPPPLLPRPRFHTWLPQELDDLCVLRIHARLSYTAIGRAMRADLGLLGKDAKVVSHKLRTLDGTQFLSERMRRRDQGVGAVRDALWIYWSSLTPQSIPVQTILRRYYIDDPPTWPTQTHDDYLVVLVLYGNLSDELVAQTMNRSFRKEGKDRYTAETVSKKFEELEALVEGSWGWWMTAGAADAEVQDILRRCRVHGAKDGEKDGNGDGDEHTGGETVMAGE